MECKAPDSLTDFSSWLVFNVKKISTKIAFCDLRPSAFFISKPGIFAVWWRKSVDSAIHSFTHHLAANHWTDSAGSCQWHQTPPATACQNNNTTGRDNVFCVCHTAPNPAFSMFPCVGDSWIRRNFPIILSSLCREIALLIRSLPFTHWWRKC